MPAVITGADTKTVPGSRKGGRTSAETEPVADMGVEVASQTDLGSSSAQGLRMVLGKAHH